MASIHPSSIVDPKAELADDVEIGPFCVIEGPAVIGNGTKLLGSVYLKGKVTLGERNTVYPQACLGFEPQAKWYKGTAGSVLVGDNNLIREGATIHRSRSDDAPTIVGNDNYIMTNAHVGHDSVVGNRCVLAAGVLLGGHCEIHDDVFIGGNAAVHQFCRIGRLGFLGGSSAVVQDLPPFGIASGFNHVFGCNLVGLRRAGLAGPVIDRIRQAFQVIYLDGHTNKVSVEILEKLAAESEAGAAELRELARFVATTKRGLTVHAATASKHSMQR